MHNIEGGEIMNSEQMRKDILSILSVADKPLSVGEIADEIGLYKDLWALCAELNRLTITGSIHVERRAYGGEFYTI